MDPFLNTNRSRTHQARSSHMSRSVLLLGLAFVLAASSANAQGDDSGAGNLRTFCSGDYLSLCNGMDPKGPEVVACFRKNMGKISPGCLAAIDEYRAAKASGSKS